MEYVSIVNWDKFQHYGNRRNPPWIRLYNSLIENYRWGLLSDVSKAHLIGLFLLASRTSNRIPADPAWIARRIQARDSVNLAELLENGFIVPAPEECSRNASPEESREEKKRTEKSSAQVETLFSPPTVEEVAAYAREVGYEALDAAGFVARYAAVGWRMGHTPITDWRPLVERWRCREPEARGMRSAGAVGKKLMLQIAQEEGLL